MRLRFPHSELRAPAPRRSHWFRSLWLLPTNAVGRLVAWLLCSEPPVRLGGPAARALVYTLPRGRFHWIGAVALGHVIVISPRLLEGRSAAWTVAHELAHTRQHDVLGPLYLPLHGLLQLISMLLSWFRPLEGFANTHAYNPLERGFIAVPYDFLVHGEESSLPRREALLRDMLVAFGLERSSSRPSVSPSPPH